jgi:hypothetical protein
VGAHQEGAWRLSGAGLGSGTVASPLRLLRVGKGSGKDADDPTVLHREAGNRLLIAESAWAGVVAGLGIAADAWLVLGRGERVLDSALLKTATAAATATPSLGQPVCRSFVVVGSARRNHAAQRMPVAGRESFLPGESSRG